MPSIKIKNLDPIEKCEMNIEDFTVLTDCQASGKSTIAKAIYFCRTVKDDILDEILKYTHKVSNTDIKKAVYSKLRNKYMQTFGNSVIANQEMNVEYLYNKNTFIKISITETQNYVDVSFSDDIEKYISNISKDTISKDKIKNELNKLFNDEYDSFFIPAGRSVITLLTSQLNYLFAAMDDEQKRSIDYCTQKYIEFILKIKPLFSAGMHGLIAELNYSKIIEFTDTEKKIESLITNVLKGDYIFANGEERLYLDEERYVKINFTSC